MARITYRSGKGKSRVLRIKSAREPGLYEVYNSHYLYRIVDDMLVCVNPETGFCRRSGMVVSHTGLEELDRQIALQLRNGPVEQVTLTVDQLKTLISLSTKVEAVDLSEHIEPERLIELRTAIDHLRRLQAEAGVEVYTDLYLDRMSAAINA
jgi:hypothetical protein